MTEQADFLARWDRLDAEAAAIIDAYPSGTGVAPWRQCLERHDRFVRSYTEAWMRDFHDRLRQIPEEPIEALREAIGNFARDVALIAQARQERLTWSAWLRAMADDDFQRFIGRCM